MKIKHLSRAVALVCTASLALTGCSSFISDKVQDYPLEASLTKQELVDYYARALEYDSIVSRNLTVHKTNYEKYDIDGAKAEKLKQLTLQTEALLNSDTFEVTNETVKLMSPDTFHYIKGVVDNEVLSNGQLKKIQGALGYYFVDVEYDITAKTPGTFNQLTSLIGLKGAFKENFNNTYSVDTNYLKVIPNKINKYFLDNRIVKCATYDEGAHLFRILDGEPPIVHEPSYQDPSNLNVGSTELTDDNATDIDAETEENEEDAGMLSAVTPIKAELTTEETIEATTEETTTEVETEETSETEEETTVVEEETTETEDSTEEVVDGTETESTEAIEEVPDNLVIATNPLDTKDTENSIIPADRKIQFDASLVNQVVGSSLKPAAKMPQLNIVYNLPGNEGTISGYGIYTAGNGGLRVYGFDRNALAGKMTLRYEFKDDVNGTGEILGTNVYPVEEKITNGINVATNNVLIPDFLQLELEKVIERADRVMCNCDLAGIMSGHLYQDMGVAVLRGYREESTGITRHMSTIRQVINRDADNNTYLIEVETTSVEGAKDIDCYGTYRDKYYVVIQQQGTEFKIVDQLRVSRDLITEPNINPDSTTQKRLVALNLAGEVPDESKEAIEKLIDELYYAGTVRLLNGPKEIEVNGKKVNVEKGLRDCFQNDREVVAEDKFTYMTSELENELVKHGPAVTATLNGKVTEWIGGYENQAEFTTEELVTYDASVPAQYLQVYYLVSKLNDKWVIDERTILDRSDVSGSDLKNIQERLGK